MKNLAKKQTTKFQSLIWNHYKKHGREMPWRGEKSAYKVLVSEIMLQQTQVSRVLSKYPQFLKVFPSIESLAKASLSVVLRSWQGLGYNRRAKFLHQLAKEVVLRHEGKIPKDYEELIALPGIGKATAGSLSAFAFNIPVPFIETNIRRVYIHHFFADRNDVLDVEILKLVELTLDKANPREWYYALMDYGAYLKSQVLNPNKKSRHYVKQPKFEGSNREVRGAILRFLSKEEKGRRETVRKNLGFELKRFEPALQGLIQEGFVVVQGKHIVLA